MQFPAMFNLLVIGPTFRVYEKVNRGHLINKRNPSDNANESMCNDYSQISRFRITEFCKEDNQTLFPEWRNGGKENRDFGYARVIVIIVYQGKPCTVGLEYKPNIPLLSRSVLLEIPRSYLVTRR